MGLPAMLCCRLTSMTTSLPSPPPPPPPPPPAMEQGAEALRASLQQDFSLKAPVMISLRKVGGGAGVGAGHGQGGSGCLDGARAGRAGSAAPRDSHRAQAGSTQLL
jgi:hypothetical protein